jgi:hypothetical protein
MRFYVLIRHRPNTKRGVGGIRFVFSTEILIYKKNLGSRFQGDPTRSSLTRIPEYPNCCSHFCFLNMNNQFF